MRLLTKLHIATLTSVLTTTLWAETLTVHGEDGDAVAAYCASLIQAGTPDDEAQAIERACREEIGAYMQADSASDEASYDAAGMDAYMEDEALADDVDPENAAEYDTLTECPDPAAEDLITLTPDDYGLTDECAHHT